MGRIEMNNEKEEMTEQLLMSEEGYKKFFYIVLSVAILYLVVVFVLG